jgi:hypothetical protein
MKKMYVLLALILVIFAVLGCDLLPKAIEVRAAPKVPIKNMSTDIDIKDELWNSLSGNVPGKIALAENKEKGNMVLVVKKDIFSIDQQKLVEEVSKLKIGNQSISQLFSVAGVTFNLSNLGTILSSSNVAVTGVLNQTINAQELENAVNTVENVKLPEIDNLEDILNGFAFTDDASGELFLYDKTKNAATSSVFDLLKYEYKINSGGLKEGTINPMPEDYENFVWDDKTKTFPYPKPQNKGVVIEKLFNDGELDADFKVSLKNNTTIRELLTKLNDLDKINAEIIAFVPLTFKARSDSAFFKISIEKAFPNDDIFLRKDGDEKQDYEMEIEYMNVEIEFSIPQFNEMFNGKEVEIGNDKNAAFTSFKRKIEKNKLIINFDKEAMDAVYEFPPPFVPTLKVLFKPADEKQLFIPYELKINEAYIELGVVASFDLEEKK